MSIQAASNKKEVESVSTRVKNTKKEIEVLKAELEKLIHSGTHVNKPPQSSAGETQHKITDEPILRQPDPVPRTQITTKKNVAITQKKPEPSKENSPKKARSYNVTEAREYIKKQREKRAEQLKSKINVADNQLDLKKQKLKELHQKTLELVNKNVQLKRERSQSRDKAEPLRLDKVNPRQKSLDRFSKKTDESSGKTLRNKSQERSDNKENVNKSRNVVQERQKSRERAQSQDRTAANDRTKPGPSQRKIENVPNNRISRPRTRKIVEIKNPPPLAPIGVDKIDANLLYPPNLNLTQKADDHQIDFEKTKFLQQENVTTAQISEDFNNKITVRPKAVSEHSIMTDACRKDSKETQTSKESNEPFWLQQPPVLPYPYNFINTVKRKLQHAINSPRSCVDVAVQNSPILADPTSEPKSREEIKEILKSASSEIKSFASHKCPNLDLQAVENLELVPNLKKPETVSKNLFVDYDSESDTSKNIPEISSESMVSSHRDKLSLDGVKNLKLQPHKLTSPVLSTTSNVKTDTNGYPEWKNDTYSSDFLKESDGNAKSSGTKSGSSSTIKTMTSERKHSDIPVPSTSSISTNKDSSRLSLKSSSSSISTEKSGTTSDKTSTISTLKDNSIIITNNAILQRRKSSEEDPTFKSLLTEGQISKSTADVDTSKTKSSSSITQVDGLSLKEPTISLSYRKNDDLDLAKSKMKNITIRPTVSTNNNVNEIHLKFEAEVRLLNDFNESLRQFMNVEKAFENLKNKNDPTMKILHNVDTQTSVVAKSSTTPTSTPNNNRHFSINYSRGSEELNDSILSNNRNPPRSIQSSTLSSEMNFSNLNVSNNSSISTDNDDNKFRFSTSNIENYGNVKNCAGLSLNMFEQLIRDEDARIQQLKAIIKIREQALLDRTKGELVWLEIQKKQLIETGKIEEASLLKKKQRGIILKHEQERNEIKKLKQMQKEASEERKNILKQQRNLIKSQLSTKNMLSKIKVKTPKERRSSFGPLRVVQSCSESIQSETSISVKSSLIEDVLSVTSHSVRVSEIESEVELAKEKVPVSNVKRTLFMREAALQKRRKAAEELLRWHRKLLDEEKKIAELEAAATSVIKRMPKLEQPPPPPPSSTQRHPNSDNRYVFNGKQLNQLWRNMTGRDDRKFVEDKVYVMSQLALERLCKSARQSASKNRKQQQKNSDASTTDGERRVNSEHNNYSSIFDPESVQDMITSQEEKTKISSSISELIDNFSRIGDEISLISRKSEQDITSLKEVESTERSEIVEDLEESKSSSHSSVQETSVLKTVTPNHVSGPEVEEIPFVEESQKTDAISSSPKEPVATSTEDSKEIEEITPIIDIEEEIVTEVSPDEKVVTESGDTKQESVVSTEETSEEKVPTEESFEELLVTESRGGKRDSTVVTEEIEQPKEKINEKEKTSEQITTESGETKPESSSVVTSEAVELPVEEEEEKSSTKPSVEEQSEVTSEKSSERGETVTTEKFSEREESTVEKPSKETTEIEEKSSKDELVITEESLETKSRDSQVRSQEIEIDTSTSPSVDSAKEALSLDEALECASKIEESLTKINRQLVDQKNEEESKLEEEISGKSQEITEEIPTEDVSTTKDVQSLQETSASEVSPKSETKSSSKSSEVTEKTPPRKTSNQIDVKKRVSEILADANAPRGDKSPRLQDLYITAYDVGSSTSPEFIETFEDGRQMPTDIFGSEAEELWRKQLAIEQEIKQLEQQQKEQIPYVFMREIPNKPPPPYTPPSSQSSLPQSVVPLDVKQINEISDYSSKVLHKAYLNSNLDKVKFSENGFKLFSKVEVTKMCAEFVFNICKDIARDHYKQFEKVEGPSWLMMAKKPQLAKTRPLDAGGLEKLMNNKLKELFGFKKAHVTESAIIKWGRKKRDHVDEILVIESQEEESQWTNFDMDELIVKDQVTNDIMKMLIDETASVFSKILAKKKIVVG